MGHSIAIRHHRVHVPERVRAHPLILSAALAVLVGSLGFAVAEPAVQGAKGLVEMWNASIRAPASKQVVELPRQWSEWEIGVEVDHMYNRTASPRVDWIRENGGR